MKRRNFLKRAMAPVVAVLGLRRESFPAISTDTAPGFVNASSAYYPAPPLDALEIDGTYCFIMVSKFSPGVDGSVLRILADGIDGPR